jgi:hypothetical protein
MRLTQSYDTDRNDRRDCKSRTEIISLIGFAPASVGNSRTHRACTN